jgi:hypothetical protein
MEDKRDEIVLENGLDPLFPGCVLFLYLHTEEDVGAVLLDALTVQG